MFKNLFKEKAAVIVTPPKAARQVETVKPITSQDIQDDMANKVKHLYVKNFDYVQEAIDKQKSANKEIIDKGNTLNNLGFVNTPTAKNLTKVQEDIADKQKQLSLEKEELNLTNKYRIEYPNNKFVPERIFKEVAEKYNLFTSEPKRYIKEIPNKNVEEIANFIERYGIVYQVVSRYLGAIDRGITVESEHKNHESALQETKNTRYDGIYHRSAVVETAKIDITAPISHFDLKNTEIKDRIISDIVVLDPIVSRPVEGGRIIISVWDKEANIPEIKNENWN